MYIPPFKLARMMQEVQDRASAEFQRLAWEVGGARATCDHVVELCLWVGVRQIRLMNLGDGQVQVLRHRALLRMPTRVLA